MSKIVTVRDLAIKALEIADALIREKGEVAPVFLGFDAKIIDGNSLLIPGSWETDEDKDHQACLVRMMFALCEVQKCVFVCEIWQAEYTREQHENYVRPADRPDRIECVGALAEDREGNSIMVCRQIMRDGERVWLKEELIEMPEPQGGRFINLLQDVGPIPPEMREELREMVQRHATYMERPVVH